MSLIQQALLGSVVAPLAGFAVGWLKARSIGNRSIIALAKATAILSALNLCYFVLNSFAPFPENISDVPKIGPLLIYPLNFAVIFLVTAIALAFMPKNNRQESGILRLPSARKWFAVISMTIFFIIAPFFILYLINSWGTAILFEISPALLTVLIKPTLFLFGIYWAFVRPLLETDSATYPRQTPCWTIATCLAPFVASSAISHLTLVQSNPRAIMGWAAVTPSIVLAILGVLRAKTGSVWVIPLVPAVAALTVYEGFYFLLRGVTDR